MMKNTFFERFNYMLKQLTTDALESAILQSLSDSPQSPKEIKTKVVVILASDNYDTNLTTSTGLDNLYIKVKDKLRAWGKKGINCKDIGNAQWVLANSETIETSPKPKAVKAPKVVILDRSAVYMAMKISEGIAIYSTILLRTWVSSGFKNSSLRQI